MLNPEYVLLNKIDNSFYKNYKQPKMENPEVVFYFVATALFTVLCCCPSKSRGDILNYEWNPPLCFLCFRCVCARCREKTIPEEPLEEEQEELSKV
jgi:hypothetical protein